MSTTQETLTTSEDQFELDDNRNYSANFWNGFFRKRRKKFEWFCEFSDVACLFDEIFNPKTASVLHIGCGNSSFPREMVAHGWTNITAIDFSDEVIQQMIEIGPSDYLSNQFLTYRQIDAMRLVEHLGAHSFDFVTEKGVLDDLVRDTEDDTRRKCVRMISQALEVLKPGGKFVLISMCRPHMLSFVAEAIRQAIGHSDSVHFYPILASNQAMATVIPFVIVISGATSSVPDVNGFFAHELGVHRLPVIDGQISDVQAHKEFAVASSMDELFSVLTSVNDRLIDFRHRVLDNKTLSSPSTTSSPLTPRNNKTRSMTKGADGCAEVQQYRKSFEIEIALSEADFDAEGFWSEICLRHRMGFGSMSELNDYTVIPIGFGIDLFRVSGMFSIEFDECFDGDVDVDGKVKYDGFLNEFVEMVQSWESVQSCVTVI